jgi:serine/threonine protein kinase
VGALRLPFTLHLKDKGQGGQGEIEGKEWDLLRYMYEIAKGMEYLHSNGILHGDLKVCSVHFISLPFLIYIMRGLPTSSFMIAFIAHL